MNANLSGDIWSWKIEKWSCKSHGKIVFKVCGNPEYTQELNSVSLRQSGKGSGELAKCSVPQEINHNTFTLQASLLLPWERVDGRAGVTLQGAPLDLVQLLARVS